MRREFERQQSLLETAALSRAQVVANWLLLLASRLADFDGGLWDPCLTECDELDADSREFETQGLQMIMRLRPAGTELRKALLLTNSWPVLRQAVRLAERISEVASEFSYVQDFPVPALLPAVARATGDVLTAGIRTVRDWDEDSCRSVMHAAAIVRRQCTTLQQQLTEQLRGQAEDLPWVLRLQMQAEWLAMIADGAAAFAEDVRRAVAACPASQISMAFTADDDLPAEDWGIRETPRV
jgi:phosphate uptake regulator